MAGRFAHTARLPRAGRELRDKAVVILDATEIVIAGAAVIGLVPLGVRSVSDMIRNHRRKKTNEMLTTVLVSVIASHVAPSVLTELTQRLGAVVQELQKLKV